MIDTNDLLRYGQAFGGRFRDSLWRGRSRPACPRCLTSRSVGVVRVDIQELPGHPMIEQRDWQCRTCRSMVRETVTA